MSADVLTLAFWAVCILAAIVAGCVLERVVPHIGAPLFPTPRDTEDDA